MFPFTDEKFEDWASNITCILLHGIHMGTKIFEPCLSIMFLSLTFFTIMDFFFLPNCCGKSFHICVAFIT